MASVIACAVAGSRTLSGGALRSVSSSAARSAPSASSPGRAVNSQPTRGAQRATSAGSGSSQLGAAAGQALGSVPANAPNATGRAPTTTEPAAAPDGCRMEGAPASPRATRTCPAASIVTPSGPDAVGTEPTTTFCAVSIATRVSWAALLTQARARPASTATPNGFRPTGMVVSSVRLTRPMTVTDPAPKLVT